MPLLEYIRLKMGSWLASEFSNTVYWFSATIAAIGFCVPAQNFYFLHERRMDGVCEAPSTLILSSKANRQYQLSREKLRNPEHLKNSLGFLYIHCLTTKTYTFYIKLAILLSTLKFFYPHAAGKINFVLKVKMHLLWKYVMKAISFFLLATELILNANRLGLRHKPIPWTHFSINLPTFK